MDDQSGYARPSLLPGNVCKNRLQKKVIRRCDQSERVFATEARVTLCCFKWWCVAGDRVESSLCHLVGDKFQLARPCRKRVRERDEGFGIVQPNPPARLEFFQRDTAKRQMPAVENLSGDRLIGVIQ